MNNNSNPGGLSADWLMSAVKKNPEGLLLLAAGCALLFRTGSSRSRQWSHGYQSYPSGQGQHGPRMEHRGSGGKDWEMPEGMSRAADTALSISVLYSWPEHYAAQPKPAPAP